MSGGVGGSDENKKRPYSELEKCLADSLAETKRLTEANDMLEDANKRLKEAKDMLEEVLNTQKDLLEKHNKTLRAQLGENTVQLEVAKVLLGMERERNDELKTALANAKQKSSPADPSTHWLEDTDDVDYAIRISLEEQKARDAELAKQLDLEMNGNSDPKEGSSSGWGEGF